MGNYFSVSNDTLNSPSTENTSEITAEPIISTGETVVNNNDDHINSDNKSIDPDNLKTSLQSNVHNYLIPTNLVKCYEHNGTTWIEKNNTCKNCSFNIPNDLIICLDFNFTCCPNCCVGNNINKKCNNSTHWYTDYISDLKNPHNLNNHKNEKFSSNIPKWAVDEYISSRKPSHLPYWVVRDYLENKK
jgi:hypothetical protein